MDQVCIKVDTDTYQLHFYQFSWLTCLCRKKERREKSQETQLYRIIDDTKCTQSRDIYNRQHFGSKFRFFFLWLTYQQFSFFTLLMSETRVRATIISSVNFTILILEMRWCFIMIPECFCLALTTSSRLWLAAVGSRLKSSQCEEEQHTTAATFFWRCFTWVARSRERNLRPVLLSVFHSSTHNCMCCVFSHSLQHKYRSKP